jgi:hypothetical protein
MALTLPSRYAADPPPNVGSLSLLPALGGLGLMILGALLTAGAVGVLVQARRARLATGVVAGVTAALAAVGVVVVMSLPPADIVLAVALTVAVLVLGAASILLLRPRR